MSKGLKFAALFFGLALICGSLFTIAMADEWNKKTKLTFSQPVEVPGHILQAGAYTFKLMDSPANRNIVQIFNEDETQLIATILAISTERAEPSDQTIVTFSERPSGSPEAIHMWFYPGDTRGQEFVYPKSRALELARASKTRVLYTEDTSGSAETLRSSRVGSVSAEGQEQEVGATGSAQTTQEPVRQPEPSYSREEAQTTRTAREEPAPQGEELPQTASELPLVGLVALVSLATALAFRVALKRVS